MLARYNLSSLCATVGEKHAKHYQMKGSTTSHTKGSGVSLVTDTGHALATDLPFRMGGTNSAPQPVETLLAALIGCTQATALFVGRNMKPQLVIDKMEFDIGAERDERGSISLPMDVAPPTSSRVQRVFGIVRVYAKGREPISTDVITILKEQTEIRCPVANMMVASGCQMDVEWVDGSVLETAVCE